VCAGAFSDKPLRSGCPSSRAADAARLSRIAQVPFQDDYRRNYFPSLEFPKNEQGDLVTEHSTLPTSEQKRVMGELIDKSILNTLGEDGCARLERDLADPTAR
jgi:hypothetical protein